MGAVADLACDRAPVTERTLSTYATNFSKYLMVRTI